MTDSHTLAQNSTIHALPRLILNHADAWGLTLLIGAVFLVLHPPATGQGILLVVSLGICYWWGFALNDYFDAPHDAQEPKKALRNFFVQVQVSRRAIWLMTGFVLLPVLLIFAQFGWQGWLIFGMGVGAMVGYSAPPFRLKSRPGFDLLTHMFFVQTFPYFTCFVLLSSSPQPLDAALLSFFLLGSLGAQLEQQIRDYEVDSRTDTNFTTRFGLGLTIPLLRLVTALLILLVSGCILLGIIPLWMVPFALLASPVMLHRFLRQGTAPRSEWLIRFALAACILYAFLLWGAWIIGRF
ncbi:MAG: UbiA family prenyltransferase [Anaerolineae bacterium]|nr:UbiA family prenyltransferase [Anaerolineae bacterium]